MIIYENAFSELVNKLDSNKKNFSSTKWAISMIKELVEQATPKKVLNIEEFGAFDFYEMIGKCPKCHKALNKHHHHKNCGGCGQALDWSA